MWKFPGCTKGPFRRGDTGKKQAIGHPGHAKSKVTKTAGDITIMKW